MVSLGSEDSGKDFINLIGLNTGKDIGTLQNINILENGPGGVVLTIELSVTKVV